MIPGRFEERRIVDQTHRWAVRIVHLYSGIGEGIDLN